MQLLISFVLRDVGNMDGKVADALRLGGMVAKESRRKGAVNVNESWA